MKTYSIRTTEYVEKSGRYYEQEVGKLVASENKMFLKLYMFPNTKFRIVEDIKNEPT